MKSDSSLSHVPNEHTAATDTNKTARRSSIERRAVSESFFVAIVQFRPSELGLVTWLVFFFFATRRATFSTRFGLTFSVSRTIRFRFAFTIARLVPIGASCIGTAFTVTRWLSSAFGRAIAVRASLTFARASAVWRSLRQAEQFRRV